MWFGNAGNTSTRLFRAKALQAALPRGFWNSLLSVPVSSDLLTSRSFSPTPQLQSSIALCFRNPRPKHIWMLGNLSCEVLAVANDHDAEAPIFKLSALLPVRLTPLR